MLKIALFFLLCTAPLFCAQKVAVIGLWPLPSVIAFWTDLEIIYLPKASVNAMENSLVSFYYPQYKHSKVGNSENLEELLALNADIYVCPKSNLKICRGLRNAGVSVIELTTNINQHNSKDTLKHWLDALAKYTPITEKNQALLNAITSIETEIASKTQHTKKPRVLIIHRMDKDNISSGIFSHYLIQNSGGENPMGYRSSRNISLEEVYKSDPEILYISNFTTMQPEDFYQAKEWQNIQAVQNKRVYKLPLATYRPFAPSLDLGPTLLFMAKINHPEIFQDLDIHSTYKQHFKDFYNIELSDLALESIFNPSIKAGILD